MHGSRLCLQVLEDVLREKLHHVYQSVCRSDTLLWKDMRGVIPTITRATYLRGTTPGSDSSEQVDSSILGFPAVLFRFVVVVLLQALVDPRASHLGRLSLHAGRNQRADDVGSRLTARDRVVRAETEAAGRRGK